MKFQSFLSLICSNSYDKMGVSKIYSNSSKICIAYVDVQGKSNNEADCGSLDTGNNVKDQEKLTEIVTSDCEQADRSSSKNTDSSKDAIFVEATIITCLHLKHALSY